MASRWLPVLVWAGVIFAFSSIPSLNSGLGTWDYVLRKGAHTTEYGRTSGRSPSQSPMQAVTSSTRPSCADATAHRSMSGSTPSAR